MRPPGWFGKPVLRLRQQGWRSHARSRVCGVRAASSVRGTTCRMPTAAGCRALRGRPAAGALEDCKPGRRRGRSGHARSRHGNPDGGDPSANPCGFSIPREGLSRSPTAILNGLFTLAIKSPLCGLRAALPFTKRWRGALLRHGTILLLPVQPENVGASMKFGVPWKSSQRLPAQRPAERLAAGELAAVTERLDDLTRQL